MFTSPYYLVTALFLLKIKMFPVPSPLPFLKKTPFRGLNFALPPPPHPLPPLVKKENLGLKFPASSQNLFQILVNILVQNKRPKMGVSHGFAKIMQVSSK